MIFTYFANFHSKATVCRRTDFEKLIHDPRVAHLIAQVRAGDKEAKKQLPGVCYQAYFPHGRRCNQDAQDSGAYMVDFDKMAREALRRLIERAIPKPEEEATSPVLLVHITPSGNGLRVVAKATREGDFAQCRTLADYQRTLARQLGAEEWLDESCHDKARFSFVPQASDVLYLSNRLFDEKAEVTGLESGHPARTGSGASAPALFPAAGAPAAGGAPVAVSRPIETPGQTSFDGLPLREIFEAYFSLTGGLPQEGARNSRFYTAARDLRYICDFNPRVVSAHLPDCGLPPGEVFQVCSSACASSRAASVPAIVVQAVTLARKLAEGSGETDDDDGDEEAPANFALPRLAAEFLECAPADFKMVTLLALLPIVGTLATRVRARYLDGELHSPSFFTVITAEQASGKSFTRRLVRQLLASIEEEDNQQRKIEQQFREELRKKKNAKELPEQPRVKIRIVPATISVAKLLQRLDFAEGDHLFTYAEEMDTLTKTNRSGAWSQKNDLYRYAHDNSNFGQDYMSDTSYSANLPIYYNLLVQGTPRQTERFFTDVENGLVSRCCFGFIPNQFAKKIPVWRPMSAATCMEVDRWVKRLREASGEVDLSFLFPTVEEWLEEQRITALVEVNHARDIFRKRSAVIAFRAVMMFSVLHDRTPGDLAMMAEFFRGVADLVMANQLAFAESKINQEPGQPRQRTKRSDNVYSALPEVFTLKELQEEMRHRGLMSKCTDMVYIWSKNQMVEKLPAKQYRKIFRGKEEHGTGR